MEIVVLAFIVWLFYTVLVKPDSDKWKEKKRLRKKFAKLRREP
jgi:hypothetical protein